VTSSEHWQTELHAATIDGSPIELSAVVGDRVALFDTGSTLNYLPPTEYKAFISVVRQRKLCWFHDELEIWYCRCQSIHDK
jgi:hypothetical protein